MRPVDYIPVIFCFLLLPLCSYAQRTCASHEVYERQLAGNPDFAKKRQEIEAFTRRYIQDGGGPMQSTVARGVATYTIPVVVHVVYNTNVQNVSDAQVQSQIAILNQDFQKMNADTTAVPAVFQPLIADCKIQFCLARQDPFGNPTTGIVRKHTTKTAFSNNDGVKKNSAGGDDAWPASGYLNLWVCNLKNNLLGYAQFPGGAAATDGVVILYSAFGNTGVVKAPYDKGRTATHEVGHWLNLLHIWGDDGGACSGSDEVSDTPNAADENYGCPSFPQVSCNNGPNGEMYMNYMDYTDDACMQMFTPGQKSRMWAILEGGVRASVASSKGCSAPAGACESPFNHTASGITQTSATLSWSAVAGATSYSLRYKVSAASTFKTINGLTSPSCNLAGLTAGTAYTYNVRTICPAGKGNYSNAATFTTLSPGCIDDYEPNDTKSTAAAIPVNTNINALISTKGDVDFFKFTTTSKAPNLVVTLSALPADYDLKLFDAAGTQIASSQNAGTTSETIAYVGAAGTYTVKVFGYNGAYNANNCYTLNVTTSNSSILKQPSAKTAGARDGILIYPQPASGSATVQFAGNVWNGMATLSVVNQTGQVLNVKQINTTNGLYRLNVSHLANGVYYVNISNNHTAAAQKLIVQH